MSAIYGVFGAPSNQDATAMGRRLQHRETVAKEWSPEDHASALQATILDTARRQCERYEAVGVSLSGGLDSALGVAAIRRVWPGKKIFTFSAGYGAEDLELRQAAEVAEHF